MAHDVILLLALSQGEYSDSLSCCEVMMSFTSDLRKPALYFLSKQLVISCIFFLLVSFSHLSCRVLQ